MQSHSNIHILTCSVYSLDTESAYSILILDWKEVLQRVLVTQHVLISIYPPLE